MTAMLSCHVMHKILYIVHMENHDEMMLIYVRFQWWVLKSFVIPAGDDDRQWSSYDLGMVSNGKLLVVLLMNFVMIVMFTRVIFEKKTYMIN